MSSASLHCFILFLLHLLISSGSSVAEIERHGKRILLSPTLIANELDTMSGNIPIVNPITPTVPTVNPTYSPIPPILPITTPTFPTITPTVPTTQTMPSSSGGQWCIASPSASETALQVALDYACGYGGADCSAIQTGGSCYSPTTVRDHASYAFNDYYRKNPSPISCVFGGTAQISSTDPSTGSCHFPAASASISVSPPSPPIPTPTPTILAPMIPAPTIPAPTIMTPTPPAPTDMTPTTTMPDGTTIDGAGEPTGLPNSATSISSTFLLLLTAIGPLLAANYLQEDGN